MSPSVNGKQMNSEENVYIQLKRTTKYWVPTVKIEGPTYKNNKTDLLGAKCTILTKGRQEEIS
jgi:hypothetical protein